jgi:hypothetical protein
MPNNKHCLGKGGKPFIAKNAGPNSVELAMEDNSRQVEGVQSWFKKHPGGFAPQYLKHVTAILGPAKDGQFMIEVEDARVLTTDEMTRESNGIVVMKYRDQIVVPTRFLRKSGRALNCPDLLKVGAAVEICSTSGCGSIQKASSDMHGPTYHTRTYLEVDFVLTAEKELEWAALGYMKHLPTEKAAMCEILMKKRSADDTSPMTVTEVLRACYSIGSNVLSTTTSPL